MRGDFRNGDPRFAFRMYLLYRILSAAGMLLAIPYYALRGRRRGGGAGALGERLGKIPAEISGRAAQGQGPIWIHAVSVGEVLAAAPLVAGLKGEEAGRAIFVSTTTETGQQLARERLRAADGIFYFPVDWTVAVRRALRAIRPALVIIMETEIWPNFLREAREKGIRVAFANARISKRSFARFERWRPVVSKFYARTLQQADVFLAQTPADAKRLAEMGAPEEKIEVTGNLKYDAEPPAPGPLANWLREQARSQERWPILVAGSVVEDEEEAVLAGYDVVQRHWRRALLVLAPRKPGRFDAAAEIVAKDGWEMARRSRLDLGEPLSESAEVVFLDSIGELAQLYAFADAVFVGGSLAPAGGHNILEPAWFGRPPVFGASMENFQQMADDFLAARAGIQVNSGPMLGKVWIQLIEDSERRERMGRAAKELSERNRGATARTLRRVASLLERTRSTA